jgi:hypothetical protein
MTQKHQIELTLEIYNPSHTENLTVKLRKYLLAGFVPQHGMEIPDSGLVFKVRTVAMAGLNEVIFFGVPETKMGLVKRTKIPDTQWLTERVSFFKNQGWSVVK